MTDKESLRKKRLYHAAYAAKHREDIAKRRAAYYQANKEKILMKALLYQQKNSAQIFIKTKAYHEAHAEELRVYRAANKERRRAWNVANKEHIAEQLAEYRRLHKEEIRLQQALYTKTHAEENTEKAHRRRARERQAKRIDLSIQQWEEIQRAYNFRCVYCGKKPKKLTKDHITPISKGGDHTMMNIVPACRSCNSRKRDRAPLTAVQPLLLTMALPREK